MKKKINRPGKKVTRRKPKDIETILLQAGLQLLGNIIGIAFKKDPDKVVTEDADFEIIEPKKLIEQGKR